MQNKMNNSIRWKKTIRNYCPYCLKPYHIFLELDLKKNGLTNTLIKPHNECNKFIIFIDPNGAVRGSQCIDTEYTNLITDHKIEPDFSHILELNLEGDLTNKGIIYSNKVKHHHLLRSSFYRGWLRQFNEIEEEFAFIYLDHYFLLTTNLYGYVLITLGIHESKIAFNYQFSDINTILNFLKAKAVSLGENVLSK